MPHTIVHLVRHGEVDNPERILYGRIPDYHLSERGRRQAQRTADAFEGHEVVKLYASPLERAQETAAPFSRGLGLEIETEDRLLEAGNQFEGLHVKGVRSQLWNPVRWPLMRNPLTPSWGEPYTEIVQRMVQAIERAVEEAEGYEAIMVSHQLPIVCIQRHMQGKRLAHNPAMRQCNLASVTSLVFDDQGLCDYRYSEPARGL
ncbi:histidine phosphatase family protein [Corynebacterium pseudopelargi]|uniref:Phosphoserine phosphatase 1 n=1 Tax=Corynebacterium pseudopelargi TaxID=2080757 RepID=A0A3G6IZK0_9CORY|nr:histidine phosphatase family protein [Corynebacterium pseudopelargi]AZA10108.1 Phosphoserine phosphatase 1 [Corynebacterium pseudopelargi]